MKKTLILLALFTFISANVQARSKAVEAASYSKSIRSASESVVSLYASRNTAKLEDNIASFTDDFVSSIDPEIKTRQENSLGSGVIVKSSGLILTNSHIVQDALEIKVLTNNDDQYNAYIVAVDQDLDLAILQIASDKEDFKAMDFADSDELYVGDVVFALGNPFGIGQSASMGIVSAIGRSSFNMEASEYLIQTDAAINPGNSGGALIDVDGKLVGLNSAIFSKTEAFSGVGFAVPSNALKFVIDTLEAKGEIQRAWLGAQGEDITPEIMRLLSLNSDDGVYITNVAKNSPAEIAGIKAGDILLYLGKKVKNTQALNSLTPTLSINQKTYAKVFRAGRVISLEVILRPISKRVESDKFIIRGNNILTGVVVEKLSAELNYMLNLPLDKEGIAVIDRPNSLVDLNLQVGDVILSINKYTIKTIQDIQQVLNQPAPYGWNFQLLRSGSKIKLFIK